MLNTRRVARELALKVLFQVDVGKQPLSEVLDGALEQVRATVNNPISQIVREAQVSMRTVAMERSAGTSTQSARQIRQAATSAGMELRALAERAAEQTTAVLAENPVTGVEEAEEAVKAVVERAGSGLRRIAGRDSLYPEVLAELTEMAGRKAHQIEATFQKHLRTAAQIAAFTVQLVHGATERHEDIDARLAALSAGWRLERQAAVDRNIMRLAAYEILFMPDIPTGASINEAVELAKKYSTAESGRFVNGVLGALAGKGEDLPLADEPAE